VETEESGSVPGRGKRFSLPQSIRTGCEAHQVSYVMGVLGSLVTG
jgi:hypothetical protein